MERHDVEIYGPHMVKMSGYIAHVGSEEYCHRFGGNSWLPIDNKQVGYGPTLVLTLDIRDPRLSKMISLNIAELPLCFYLNCVTVGKQIYEIDYVNRNVMLVYREEDNPEILAPEDCLPKPLPEKPLKLVTMDGSNYPSNEDLYWNCCAELCGRGCTIRILGPPVWMDCTIEEICDCGKNMLYVAKRFCVSFYKFYTPTIEQYRDVVAVL